MSSDQKKKIRNKISDLVKKYSNLEFKKRKIYSWQNYNTANRKNDW